ncbi:hypothetical protein H9Y04_06570 [Streptomyces sp. TRM66268-LWL]|uniref:Uncharacterized protein n=1 Tax=Streptomyces polyasparticus TaxID=2767826 RepID=A0ABR7S9T5_9ACTN|nr:hypothetical protein [Streptomyces polyasparticus]MBC9712235.1 hypothetical protein [Streptomyces polyasparticus]
MQLIMSNWDVTAWSRVALKATEGLDHNEAIVEALAHYGAFTGNHGVIKAKPTTIAYRADLGRDCGPLETVVRVLTDAGLVTWRSDRKPQLVMPRKATA